MKHLFTCIATLALLLVGNVQAQRSWDYESVSVDQINAGTENYYVIQQGIGKPSIAVGGFLNSGDASFVMAVNHSCVFNFIEVGEREANDETFKIYILKNLANGQYVCTPIDGVRYTANATEAFRFTARKAKEISPNELDKNDWYNYSCAVQGIAKNGGPGLNAGAEEAGAWVFCSPEKFQFLSFNENPGFGTTYITNTNWRVYAAKERQMSAYEKFLTTYDLYLTNGVSPEDYPVGINPGCISQELYDKLEALYKEAYNLTAQQGLEDQVYNDMNQRIVETFAEYEANRIKVAPGYYAVMNMRQGLLSNKDKAVCDNNMELPEKWNLNNAKYIWQVENSETEGKIWIKSLLNEKYLGNKANSFALTDNPKGNFVVTNRKADLFYINDGSGYLNAKNDGSLTLWADLEGSGNHWKFFTISKDSIEALANDLTQFRINEKLRKLANNAAMNLKALKTKSGLTMDGNYAPIAQGLVSHFEKCNATETREGNKESFAFDNDVNTSYHTLWNNNAPTDDWHWVQLDFGKEIQDLYIKLTKRGNNENSNPTRYQIITEENNSFESSIWNEILFQDTIIYDYPTTYIDTVIDSATYIKKIHLERPAQHVRFAVTHTVLNKIWGYGPTWNLAEMRFYDVANCVPNPSFDLIPADVIAHLNDCIAKANGEVKEGLGTTATYDELQAAVDSMWAAYPSPNQLKRALEDAQALSETADESQNEMGYYQQGAKAELQKEIDAINAIVTDENHVLTLEDIAQLTARLEKAIDVFYGKLIVPEDGYYHIISRSLDKQGNEDNKTYSYISTVNADPATPAVWAYKGDAEINCRWNTVWKIEKGENGYFSFKNLASGLYLDNPYEGLTEEEQEEIEVTTKIAMSKTPKYMRLQTAPIAGQFMLAMKENRFVNCSGQPKVGLIGSPMAVWGDKKGESSRFVFEEINPEDFSTSFNITCRSNEVQIFSLPMDLIGVYTATENGYKVLGKKDNKIILKYLEENELIPAGTPFIIKTNENETSFETVPNFESFEAVEQAKFVYTPVEQNGLVSAPLTTTVNSGFGLIFQGKVVASNGGETISAGTGFFNANIPETLEEGNLQLEIVGEITNIEEILNAPVTNSDVYTLSGVKIRQNVKGSAATQGLPKGIYIVGNKKVIVK